MPTKLPEDIEKSIARLRDPSTPFDHIEHGGWLVTRLWESETEYDVVAGLVVSRSTVSVPPKPRVHGHWRPKPK